MSEPRGSSVNAALPPIHDPDSGTGPLGPGFDEAPTQIKSPVSPETPSDQIPDALNAYGVTLGHFELLDCIGVGGMGRVFRARDTNLDRMVAVKVLSPDVGKDPEVCRRFEQEGKAAARLDDRHFARVYYCGKDKSLQYIAMEYVEGENLRTMIERHGRLDFEMVVNIGIQIARGLAHAARCGVVHRDIKPSNIIITPTGTAKLVDMGLARNFLQQSSPASEITQAGATLGTFDYISPEQARDARDADVRSDIYSLGCTMYHALAGRPPYPDGSALQKLLQHQNDAIPDIRRFAPDLPDVVAAVLHKMMAKDPRDRYQTPAALIADLIAICAELNIPLPEESEYVADLGTGQSFWERQLVWLVPSVIFCLVIWLYSVFEPRSQVVLPNRIERAAGETELVSRRTGELAANQAGEISPATITPVARVFQVQPGELRKRIAEAPPGSTLQLQPGRYELFPMDPFEVLIDKPLRIIGPDQPSELAIISITDDARADFSPALSMFKITKGAQVTFRRVQFDMTCNKGEGFILSVAGGDVVLDRCAFYLKGGTAPQRTGIMDLQGSEDIRVAANQCFFDSGNDGIRTSGSGNYTLSFEHCGFLHAARPFVLRGSGKRDIRLDHVSVRVLNVPVIDIDRVGTDDQMQVSNCVFSQNATVPVPLIQATQDDHAKPISIWWWGRGNLYHGFETSSMELHASSVALPVSHPVSRLFASVEANESLQNNPALFFRLSSPIKYVDEVGLPLGITEGAWGAVYSEAELKQAFAAAGERRIAANEPKSIAEDAQLPYAIVEGGVIKSQFRYLESACREAQDGATIEVASDADFDDAHTITIASKKLTIQARSSEKPPLFRWNARAADSRPAVLLRLKGGSELKIRGIDFEVTPAARVTSGSGVFACEFGSNLELIDCSVDVVADNGGSGTLPVFLMASGAASDQGSQMPALADVPDMTNINLQLSRVRSAYSILEADPLSLWALGIRNCFLASEMSLVRVYGPSVMLADTTPNKLEIQNTSCATGDSLVVLSIDGSEPPRQMEVSAGQSVFIGGGLAFARSSGNFASERHSNSFHWQVPLGSINFVAGYPRPLQYSTNAMSMGTVPSSWGEFPEFVVGKQDISEFWDEPVLTMQVPDEKSLRSLGLPENYITNDSRPGVPPVYLRESVRAD